MKSKRGMLIIVLAAAVLLLSLSSDVPAANRDRKDRGTWKDTTLSGPGSPRGEARRSHGLRARSPLRRLFNQTIQELEAKIQELEERIGPLEEKSDAAIEALLGLQKEIASLQAQLLALNLRSEGNAAAAAALEQEIGVLRSRLESEIAALLETVQGVGDELRGQIVLLQDQSAEFTALIAENQESLENLRSNLEVYAGQLLENRDLAAANSAAINSLQNLCIACQLEIARIQTDINEMNQGIIANQEEITRLWQEIDSLSSGRKVITVSPNTDVTLSDTKERLWLFMGSVNYYSYPPYQLDAGLVIDGSTVDSWSQKRDAYHFKDQYNFNFIKVQMVEAGTHTLRFQYRLRNLCTCPDVMGVHNHSLVGILLK